MRSEVTIALYVSTNPSVTADIHVAYSKAVFREVTGCTRLGSTTLSQLQRLCFDKPMCITVMSYGSLFIYRWLPRCVLYRFVAKLLQLHLH